MPRPVASGSIAFGLVSIPVRFYTATQSKAISFHLLHARCGTRIQHRNSCPTCERLVERKDLVRGYPITRNEHVRFTDDEIEALERTGDRVIEISTFVPLSTVDPIYFERAYYLGPDKQGVKPYRLLAEAMCDMERVAIASVVLRGKESLVLLRPAQGGLTLHQLYYADEVQDFGEVETGERVRVGDAELALAKRLVAGLTTEAFEPTAYKDAYRERVLALAKRKAAGGQVTVVPEAARPAVTLDLMDALKRSLERKPPTKTPTKTKVADRMEPVRAPVDLAQARARQKRRARAS